VVLSVEIKRPGSEADHSPPSSAEVKECVELYLHSPIRLHGRGAYLNTGTISALPLPLPYQLDRRLGGPKSQSGCGGEEKISHLACTGPNILIPSSDLSCYYTSPYKIRNDSVISEFGRIRKEVVEAYFMILPSDFM
jgi:hypothetical protein